MRRVVFINLLPCKLALLRLLFAHRSTNLWVRWKSDACSLATELFLAVFARWNFNFFRFCLKFSLRVVSSYRVFWICARDGEFWLRYLFGLHHAIILNGLDRPIDRPRYRAWHWIIITFFKILLYIKLTLNIFFLYLFFDINSSIGLVSSGIYCPVWLISCQMDSFSPIFECWGLSLATI